jgi:succinyl-CoA synthetase beta subunit
MCSYESINTKSSHRQNQSPTNLCLYTSANIWANALWAHIMQLVKHKRTEQRSKHLWDILFSKDIGQQTWQVFVNLATNIMTNDELTAQLNSTFLQRCRVATQHGTGAHLRSVVKLRNTYFEHTDRYLTSHQLKYKPLESARFAISSAWPVFVARRFW